MLMLIHKLDESYSLQLHKVLFTSRLAKQEWHHNESYFKIIRWYSPSCLEIKLCSIHFIAATVILK